MKHTLGRQTTWNGILLLCLTVGSGCQPSVEPPEVTRPANVVIFLVDTLRADRLGAYGYPKPTSPNIDSLAASGVLFEQASAPSPWTLPSVVSLMLSALPCEHNVLTDGEKVSAEARTLPVRLQQASYNTASFFANPYAGPFGGLEEGYDVWRPMDEQVDGEVVSTWLSSLDPATAEPFFVYIHNTEPHNPYRADPSFVERFGEVSREARQEVEKAYRLYRRLTRIDYDENRPLGTTDNTAKQDELIRRLTVLGPQIDVLYDATVAEADDRVGSVVAALEQAGVWEDTLFILLADHGEEFGDHSSWQHDQSVYEELIRVPLIIRFPRNEFAGRRVNEPVTLLDVAPTIVDYLGAPALAEHFRGISLLPLIEGAADTGVMRVTAMRYNKKKYYRPHKEERGDLNLVVRHGSWKGIWNAETDTVELYDLGNDPDERENVSQEEGELAERMRGFARARLAECEAIAMEASSGNEPELDEETRRRLEALGYVGPATNPREQDEEQR
jgi:arylsulfatase A-like enzyme